MQMFTHFVKFKPKYELERTSKFKFTKGTIDTHSTIAKRTQLCSRPHEKG